MLRINALLLSILIFAPIAVGQTVYYVDDDASFSGDGLSWATAYNQLRPALRSAQPGDQIWVAAGSYVGNFTLTLGVEMYGGFDGTETQLDQRDWTTNEAILDGRRIGSVVRSPAGATTATRIDGFTITNGSGTALRPSSTYGGGILVVGSSPTIANNTIIDNYASNHGDGGGLYIEQGAPVVVNNSIADNSTEFFGEGGGLFLLESSGLIANNRITGNHASHGGGLGVTESSPTIVNNRIASNSVSWYGGGVYFDHDSSPMVESNTISGNSAELDGGGLFFDRDSSPTVANNAIAGNGAIRRGGGVFLYFDSSPTLVNNTITSNCADAAGGMQLYSGLATVVNTIIAFNSSGVSGADIGVFRHNCVYGNAIYDYGGSELTGTDGNISVDPQLADPHYGNVHIQPNSPCVDAGSNSDASADVDMDGGHRVLPPGGTVDIGADESDGTTWLPGPYTIVRVSSTGDDANDGSSWALAKRSVQAGIDAASALGGDVWISAGVYWERIILRSYSHVYGGFTGTESARGERDWGANTTTLHGQQQGTVVTARTGYRVSTVDGLRIMGGSANHGGGVLLECSGPTIANATITGNSAGSSGGGLRLDGAFATIFKSMIAGNNSGGGGGLSLRNSVVTIADCTIIGNTSSGSGGGLTSGGSSLVITRSLIAGNRADNDGGGLLMGTPNWGYTQTVVNNLITGNTAGRWGGGLELRSRASIVNNTITGNHASDGGGLSLYLSSPNTSAAVINNIIAFNSSGAWANAPLFALTLEYNCVYGNTAYDYSELPDSTGTGGNISADPLFVREADPGFDGEWGTEDDNYGDLRLSVGSPVIDAGNTAELPADELDLDGDGDVTEPMPFDFDAFDRFMDNPLTPDTGAGDAPIVDMGAFEFGPDDCRHGGGLDHDGDLDLIDYAGFGRCVAGPYSRPGPYCLCFDLDANGTVDLADVAAFQTRFTGE